MAKYIDAEMVIAALTDTLQYDGLVMDELISVVANIPAADVVERKKGMWMRYGEDGNPNTEDTVFWQCSECMETYTGRTTMIPNFCPNCGCSMMEEE